MSLRRATFLLVFLLLGACSGGPTEVLVLGMVHSDHVDSALYDTEDIKAIVRTFEPDWICAEIPPDRLERATIEFERDGTILEERVRRFPEYTDAIFPLTREMDFEIIPCAAWTQEVADARREKLDAIADDPTRSEQWEEHVRAWRDLEGFHKVRGADDPLFIHSQLYNNSVRDGMRPYDIYFNDDLGAGGWSNINAAHWALIEAHLDSISGRGDRVLITFGAWHKYWFIDRLNERDDVELIDASRVIREALAATD